MTQAEENVVIQQGDCRVTFLPSMGGKIGSLTVRGRELLQTPLHPYAKRSNTIEFSEGDASGWDECLPSVGECDVETESGTAHVPDHGDLWRIPWQVLEATKDSTTMQVECFSLPLQLTRSAILSSTPIGWRLQLLYSLINIGKHHAPWSWSAHPLFSVEPGDSIALPEDIQTLRLEGSGGNRLGKGGDSIAWPITQSSDGASVDLRNVEAPESSIGDKLFAGPFASGLQSWASLERRAAGVRLTVRFEPSLTPYLGVWICYGGWPDTPGPKQVAVALEPSTAPVDALSVEGPWSRWLAPEESFTWPMELEIERLDDANMRAT